MFQNFPLGNSVSDTHGSPLRSLRCTHTSSRGGGSDPVLSLISSALRPCLLSHLFSSQTLSSLSSLQLSDQCYFHLSFYFLSQGLVFVLVTLTSHVLCFFLFYFLIHFQLSTLHFRSHGKLCNVSQIHTASVPLALVHLTYPGFLT